MAASLSFTELFSRYFPSVEMAIRRREVDLRGVPAVPAAGVQPENVSERFLFLVMGPGATVLASVTQIGWSAR